MQKKFNITGSCNPQRHYMVNTEERFRAVKELIDAGEYFTINRARQYGKTTLLLMVWRRLSESYLVVPMSFEGLDSSAFDANEGFVSTFSKMMARHLASQKQDDSLVAIWRDSAAKTMDDLSALITTFCQQSKHTGTVPLCA